MDDLFVGVVFVGNVGKTVNDDWKADLGIGGTCVTTYKFDTGADENVFLLKVYKKVNKKKSIYKLVTSFCKRKISGVTHKRHLVIVL